MCNPSCVSLFIDKHSIRSLQASQLPLSNLPWGIRNTFLSQSCVQRHICALFDMGLLNMLPVDITPSTVGLTVVGAILAALLVRIVHCQFFHPLSKFPGPWWATSFSLVGALISVKYLEPRFLTYLVKKYGSKSCPPTPQLPPFPLFKPHVHLPYDAQLCLADIARSETLHRAK